MEDSIKTELKPIDTPISQKAREIPNTPLSIADSIISDRVKSRRLEHTRLGKIFLFGISLYLFVLAITLMKSGAQGITPLLSSLFKVSSAVNSLGFGWLFAYMIMSGSPVAAAALTFFDAGIISDLGAFMMITGSRLGASLIVILIGFIYVLRGRNRETSLSMGILSFTVTASSYFPGLLLGIFLLRIGFLDHTHLGTGALLNSVFDKIVEPVSDQIVGILPNWMVFLSGILIIILSFNFFDKCLSQMTLKGSQLGWVSRLVYRPGIMFALGAFITLISMSVSISLSLLVPLSQRGFVRRENIIPYIMGANITTFIDTLLASMLLENQSAICIVLVEMVSITIISMIILVVFYSQYQKLLLNFNSWATRSNWNVAISLVVILVVPIVLLVV